MAAVQNVEQSHTETAMTDSKGLETGGVQITSTEVTASDAAHLADAIPSATTQQTPKSSHEEIATKIANIISTYGLNFERTGSWDGLSAFLPIVQEKVERGEPVKMLLPGFPVKSPNYKDKTLGVLPDFGEEIALRHLNGLCDNIAQVYDKGAEVHICSDGLVYNDLLGISDEAVWDYTSAVRQIAAENGLNHIRFLRLCNLLDHPGNWTSEEFYVTHAGCIRRELVYRYGDKQFEEDMATKSDSDMRMTHASYLRYLEKDLALYEDYQKLSDEEKESEISRIAKTMMARWKAFSAALEASNKDCVRLSIHDSGGSGKLSMALIPQGKGELGSTPWHACLVIEEDGRYRTATVEAVRDTHTLVYRHGRPYFYRAKSDLFDWTADGLDVTFEHQYPCGLIIRPVTAAETNVAPSIRQVPAQKVRQLSNKFSPIVLRGFSDAKDEEAFKGKAHELGNVLKDQTEVSTDETKKLPGFQFFSYLATPSGDTKPTLFASSRLFFRYLLPPWSVEKLEQQGQGKLPVVVHHPVTKEPCLRWHESWSRTEDAASKASIDGGDESLISIINQGISDHRTGLRFSEEEGDILFNDNLAVLHIETAGRDQEIRKIDLE